MEQHISQQDIEKYLDRSLSPDQLLAADEHLAACDECFSKMAAKRAFRASSVLETVLDIDPAREEHLAYDQLSAYVDDGANEIDREIVDAHTSACRSCSDQLGELLNLEEERATAAAASRVVSASKQGSTGGWWSGIVSAGWLRLVVPAAAVVLIGVMVWLVWFTSPNGRTDVAQVSEAQMDQNLLAVTQGSPANEPDIVQTGTGEPDEPSNTETNQPQTPMISLADGGNKIEIDPAGNLTGLNAPRFEGRVKEALTSQNIRVSRGARELSSGVQVLMGDGQPGTPFALTAPIGKLVESDRPKFRWRPLKGADSYVVTVFDGSFNKVAESPQLNGTVWASGTRLKRGTVYRWQVTAIKDGEEIKSPVMPAPEAKFKVLDDAASGEIASAKRSNSHLILGIAYANAGLITEAEREFQALIKQNPNSPVVQRLLKKIKSAR